jgi:hypothetical protein
MKNLYIVGNGFDRYHGIPSGYGDFRRFVQSKDRKLHDSLEQFFNADELWSDFEQTLAYMDMDEVREYAGQFLVGYGDDHWSDANHHDYQYEVNEIVKSVTETLRKLFTEWILSLAIPTVAVLKLDATAQYINFNYTATLQKTYAIPETQVFHIHNQAQNASSELILGHGVKPEEEVEPQFESDEQREQYEMGQGDPRVEEGEGLIRDYYLKTYKDTATVIKENEAFFKSLSTVTEIRILGHSLSIIDIEYFREVAKNVSTSAKWIVSCHSDADKSHHLAALNAIGIDSANIRLVDMNYFK